MADVQVDKGEFTRVANSILEQLAKAKLNGTQMSMVLIIWRYTYGFQKKIAEFSLTFLSNATGCDKRQIQRELKTLTSRKIVIQKPGNKRILGFNKDFDSWGGKNTIGKFTNGETTNGENTNENIGESTNTSIGESTNQKRKKENKESICSVFDHWNSKEIIKHRELNEATKSAINARLEKYSPEEIIEAINNYSEVITGEQYFFSYKWTLKDFMSPENLPKFLTENDPFTNYSKDRKGQARAPTRPKKKDKFIEIYRS